MRHGLMQLVDIELAFPAADHHGGDAVADEIGQRAAFAHELVDAEDDGDRLDRDIRHDSERGGERCLLYTSRHAERLLPHDGEEALARFGVVARRALQGLDAVSYTHLDVYKRQLMNRTTLLSRS